MAPDRDPVFERALARHLRAHAENEAGAHPDAETLAAYHERLLDPDEMAIWKQHISACQRCQEILSNLEATDDILVDVANEEVTQGFGAMEIPEVAAARSSRAAEARQILASKTIPSIPVPHTPAAQPAPQAVASRWSRRFRMSTGTNWRWLAPAGALAAALLLWIAFHENRPASFEWAKNQRMAEPMPPGTASPSATAPVNVPASATKPELVAPSSIAREADANSAPKPTTSSDQNLPSSAPSGGASVGAIANKAEGVEAQRKENRDADGQRAVARVVPPPAQATPSSATIDERSDALRGVPDQAELKSRSLAKDAPAVSKQKQIAAGRQAPEPSSVATNALSTATSNTATVLQAKSQGFVTIASPGSAVFWRVASGGIIQRSSDSGSTWTLQTSGVVADLLAGSAPSDRVCWIVGRSGAILRTTDAGAYWQKIPSPIPDDLTAVFGVDAQQASISSSQSTYRTTDAGRTWTKLK